MAAIITSSIPQQNFEIIRDRIAAILTLELANQYALNNSYPNVQRAWIERFMPFNSETDLPTVNVSIERGDYSNRTQKKSDGAYVYNIDVYTSAATSENTGPADQFAMITMNKLLGMCRAILSNPAYNILGLSPGIIMDTCVDRLFISDASTVKDALSSALGRLQFVVRAVENVDLYSIVVPLTESTTTVYLKKSTDGLYVTVDGADIYEDADGDEEYESDNGGVDIGYYLDHILI